MNFESILQIFLIIFGFGLLIGIHEFGHFIAAKWAGIRTHVFAIGMGPTLISYRKGIGLCIKSSELKVKERFGKSSPEMSDNELKANGISETEYTLKLLPLGGFVSMLGQEDGKPDVVSNDPRSYNNCAIGKRMVVVSAGVILNFVLAAVFFLISFQMGVKFEAPIIGDIKQNSPAALTASVEDASIYLQSGDHVHSVNGKNAETFTDIQIAGAMAKPNDKVVLEVQKSNGNVYTFNLMPTKSPETGLLELGVYPASSLTLRAGQSSQSVDLILENAFTTSTDIHSGMTLSSANGFPLSTWDEFNVIVQDSEGEPLQTTWENGQGMTQAMLKVSPEFQILRPTGISQIAPQNYEHGILGLVPLVKVSSILDSSPNINSLHMGDVFLAVGDKHYPRMGQLRNYIKLQPNGSLNAQILRDGQVLEFPLAIHGGKIGAMLVNAWEIPIFASPLLTQLAINGSDLVVQETAIFDSKVKGGEVFSSVNGKPASDWVTLRKFIANSQSSVLIKCNEQNGAVLNVEFNLNNIESKEVSSLGWTTQLVNQAFEPLFVTRSSNGNPIKAITMGCEETVDMVIMTYLTIDRLMRRTVGVEQLRGPIGIIHIGSKIADRGFSYLLFFLAIISVNLAVLNFLPLPIVDGGLFLYLVYEKLVGKPPSLVFQNVAALFGLCLIGMLFVVTFYNDIMRLIG